MSVVLPDSFTKQVDEQNIIIGIFGHWRIDSDVSGNIAVLFHCGGLKTMFTF